MSERREQKSPLTTTNADSPAPSDEYSLTVGPGGPNLLQDRYLNEKLAYFVRERIPDRVYHVKGGGAVGMVFTAQLNCHVPATGYRAAGRTPLKSQIGLSGSKPRVATRRTGADSSEGRGVPHSRRLAQ